MKTLRDPTSAPADREHAADHQETVSTPPQSLTPSLLALLLANALPMAGVLFLDWKVFPLVLLYWLENVIVGSYNVVKLLFAQPGTAASWAGKMFLIPFFMVHFGMFTYVHGVFVFELFGPPGTGSFDLRGAIPDAIRTNELGWAVLALAASHGLSFYWNYIRNGEYARASLNALMAQPYGRVVVLHLTVLFGGWIVLLSGSPLLALVLLIVIKTGADVRAHRAERRKFATSA